MSTLKNTWHHIRRSPFQSLAAISTLTFTFFIFNLFYVFRTGLMSTLSYFESKPEITIFLKDGLTKEKVESIQKELANYPNIRQITFISKQKALEIYKEQNKNNPLLTEMVSANILPASFEVSATDPQVLSDIADNFKNKSDVVDELIYQQDVVDSLAKWTANIRRFGFVSIVVLASLAFFVIFIIIAMKITNRQSEIKISRLLGASKFYVKKAFLLEGLVYGLVASIFSFSASIPLLYRFTPQINNFFQPVVFIKLQPIYLLKLFLISSSLGISISYLASLVGVKIYIKY
ncbi:hypothetical protein DRH14_04070 [Candidatus Shapirobacteria bacterium]|nr:MAG: hypothetical protein DRH14_04070 [Candidatus Shapirobacteria bacterium]